MIQNLDTIFTGGSGGKPTNPATARLCSRFRAGAKWGQTGGEVGANSKSERENHSFNIFSPRSQPPPPRADEYTASPLCKSAQFEQLTTIKGA
jgi:hypothetical protein